MNRAGPSAEWTAKCEQVYPRVYRALVAALLDPEMAQDAIQDAVVEGIRRQPADQRNVAGWLYRVALRSARRDKFRQLRLKLRMRGDPHSDLGIASALDRLVIGQYLGTLTQRQREAVIAHYYLGLHQWEIADLFEVAQGTVAATLSQAIGKMRKEAQRGA